MNYYFPSILTSLDFSKRKLPEGFLYVNNGENAVRLLLRSYGLRPGSKIALPLFVCDSLKQAVLKQGFEPLYLDLKDDGTFWTNYNIEILKKEKPAAVILVHLYGFLHPDAKAVMDFCKEHGMYLIHDAAQSYGIAERNLVYSSGLVYSFGPGKSSTAAGGALVKGLTGEFYNDNCSSVSLLQGLRAKLFLKSRIYGYKFSLLDKLLQKVIYRFKSQYSISKMTGFQLAAAATAIDLVSKKGGERKERYKTLKEGVMSNNLLSVPFDDEKGLYFKLVVSVRKDVERFKEYLRKHNVPFFALANELIIGKEKHSQYAVFSKNAGTFVELSTEASIPMKEIVRLTDVLKKYT